MVQHPIFEGDAKKILIRFIRNPNFKCLEHINIEDDSQLEIILQSNPWLLENKLVIKPDQCIKGRGIAGVVGLNLSWDEVCTWLFDHRGKECQFGKVRGVLSRFIVEPFIRHEKSEEYFLCIFSGKDYDSLLFSSQGGIHVGDVIAHSFSLKLKVTEDLTEYLIVNHLLKSIPSQLHSYLSQFILEVFNLFRELHFTYLEINPLIFLNVSNLIYIVDVAAKVDTCAEFLCEQNWALTRYPPTFGREISETEQYIAKLDAKSGSSLKFVLLNKTGKVWTMVAGGGASVVFSDTICDLGYSKELANYGEYSGAPTIDETFEYAITILRLMVSSQKRSDGKILIIGGGIANFTNVATTFKGIIKALKIMHSELIQHKVSIFVRRGGPNYEEGLKNIKNVCDDLGIPAYVFGIDVHMTAIVGMALGIKPITNTMEFIVSDFVSLPSKEIAESSTSTNNGSTNDKRLPTIPSSLLFCESTTSIVWGFQEIAIQGMLDFDYLCKRKNSSVSCMIYPFRASFISKFYFGLKEIFIPIFGTFEEATRKFPDASVLINFASMRSSFEVSIEALEYSQFKTISIFAEGIPERFTQKLNYLAQSKGIMIIGPASIGGIKPGNFRIGHAGGMIHNILSSNLYRPGSVCYVTRSGGMANELNNILSMVTDGVYEGIHLGGDRYPGTSYMDHIKRFNKDPNVELIVILGEVGGMEEYSLCEALKNNEVNKPVIAWCIGTCSSYFDTNIQFGHANACADALIETAVAKNKALRESGAFVPDSFDGIPSLIKNIYEERVSMSLWKVKPKITPPPIPVDYKYAKEMGLIRKPTSFISTICDDRGSEPVYSGYSISTILNENLGIGGAIGLLWFQRLLPDHMIKFIEMCIIILADHGPAVSGAHNTIVTARAGKDMLSSLCSGLLTIGDRFGGAINGAASQFWSAYKSKKAPSVFVQEMRKKGELILGIGHLIKSTTNPDVRVKKLIEFVKNVQATPLLDYALEVEKITTSKKSNLILNVDGTIAVCMIDMMLFSKSFSHDDVQTYINLCAFNAIFILSRSIGFIGHYIDQNRLKQGLYRHPWDDISFISGLDFNN